MTGKHTTIETALFLSPKEVKQVQQLARTGGYADWKYLLMVIANAGVRKELNPGVKFTPRWQWDDDGNPVKEHEERD